jgi:2-dehydropantoate 2-reductase
MDLASGKPKSEVAYLNGAVTRHASTLGLKAPINQTLTDILEGIVAGRIPWAEYRSQPQKLSKQVLQD